MPPRKYHLRVRPRKKGVTTRAGNDDTEKVCQNSAQESASSKGKENKNDLVEDDVVLSPLTDDQMSIKQMLEEAIQHVFVEFESQTSAKATEQANIDFDFDIDVDIYININIDLDLDIDFKADFDSAEGADKKVVDNEAEIDHSYHDRGEHKGQEGRPDN